MKEAIPIPDQEEGSFPIAGCKSFLESSKAEHWCIADQERKKRNDEDTTAIPRKI